MPVFFIMSRFHSYLNAAVNIIDTYKGDQSFHFVLQQFFASHKKMGSRDRKTVASLCYQYFRTCKALNGSKEEKIIHAVFLCETSENALLRELHPDLADKTTLPLQDKIEFLKIDLAKLFPFKDQLGEAINFDDFARSFMIQPKLFVRVRPGKLTKVLGALKTAGIVYEQINANSLTLQHATSVKDTLAVNKDVLIQDLNSQNVFNFLEEQPGLLPSRQLAVWDCCAASGGKSILLYDKLKGNIKLTVSDIRKNMLSNLQQRLQQAGIPIYNSLVADLSKVVPELNDSFDIIICDAPCTGSGTWSRTPEQLAFFKPASIIQYAALQKKIAENASTQLKQAGLFFYITCSVFRDENEAVVEFLQSKCKLQLLQQNYLKGYDKQGDTMFVAVLKK